MQKPGRCWKRPAFCSLRICRTCEGRSSPDRTSGGPEFPDVKSGAGISGGDIHPAPGCRWPVGGLREERSLFPQSGARSSSALPTGSEVYCRRYPTLSPRSLGSSAPWDAWPRATKSLLGLVFPPWGVSLLLTFLDESFHCASLIPTKKACSLYREYSICQ